MRVDRPNIKLGDWIVVESQDCVVSAVLEPIDAFGDCKVIFNPSTPTYRDVEWMNGKWRFAEGGHYGGYAEHFDRLRPYVIQLITNRRLT